VRVSGKYKAYGQDLTIEQGRLLYAGQAITDPQVNLIATRTVETVTAKLVVSGSAQKPLLEKKLQGRGLKLLYSVAWPGQGIYTKEPLKSVADLKGTKFRTYSPLTARLAELLGANPTVVQVPDVPQMFATGGIQAMITSSATGTATKAWEYVKNYYDTSAFHPKNAVVVNSRAFSRLSAADQAAIVRVASTAETRGWAMSKVRTLEANELLACVVGMCRPFS